MESSSHCLPVSTSIHPLFPLSILSFAPLIQSLTFVWFTHPSSNHWFDYICIAHFDVIRSFTMLFSISVRFFFFQLPALFHSPTVFSSLHPLCPLPFTRSDLVLSATLLSSIHCFRAKFPFRINDTREMMKYLSAKATRLNLGEEDVLQLHLRDHSAGQWARHMRCTRTGNHFKWRTFQPATSWVMIEKHKGVFLARVPQGGVLGTSSTRVCCLVGTNRSVLL